MQGPMGRHLIFSCENQAVLIFPFTFRPWCFVRENLYSPACIDHLCFIGLASLDVIGQYT